MIDADYSIAPSASQDVSAPKRLPRGQLVRLILGILREAFEPLSARDIARKVMTFQQMDTSDQGGPGRSASPNIILFILLHFIYHVMLITLAH
jgi:hypothetical protein